MDLSSSVPVMIPYPIQCITWTPNTTQREELCLLDTTWLNLDLFALTGSITVWKDVCHANDTDELQKRCWGLSSFFSYMEETCGDQGVHCKKDEDGVWRLQFTELDVECEGEWITYHIVEIALESIPLTIRGMLFSLKPQGDDGYFEDGYFLFSDWFQSTTGFRIIPCEIGVLCNILRVVTFCREVPSFIDEQVARKIMDRETMSCRAMLVLTRRTQRGLFGKLSHVLLMKILERVD